MIDPNYWSDSYDREMSLRGLKLAREIMRQDALKPYVLAERLPGPDIDSDDRAVRLCLPAAKTDHHPAGTCAMGTGVESVVSPDLKVHGIEGLRVCDASVMPYIVSSNTNAATIMIAEKASDMIMGKPPLAAAPLAA